jgi:hypothetical protein
VPKKQKARRGVPAGLIALKIETYSLIPDAATKPSVEGVGAGGPLIVLKLAPLLALIAPE